MGQLRLKGRRRVDLSQPVAEPGQRRPLLQLGAQRPLLLSGMGQGIFQGAVFFQQLQGGLFPHPGDSGDVVRSVPHEPLQVHHPLRRKAIGCQQGLFVVFHGLRNALLGHQHMGMGGDQLQSVPVPRHQQGVAPRRLRHAAGGAQDIVRLITFALAYGDAHGLQYLPQQRKLGAKIRRGRPAARLIFPIFPMPEGGPFHIKCHHQIIRLPLQ